MSVLHEQILTEYIEKLLLNEPQWSQVLTRVCQKMRAREFNYVDDVVQTGTGRGQYSLADAYVMASIDNAMFERKIARLTIQMPMEAQPDKNLQQISKSLEGQMAPFMLEIWGRSGDQDGMLSWERPVRGYFPPFIPLDTLSKSEESHALVQLLIPPWHVPVEVGSTKASRTWLHFLEEGGLARWAYGSKDLNVYILVEPLNDNSMFEGRSYPKVTRLEPSTSAPSKDLFDHYEWTP